MAEQPEYGNIFLNDQIKELFPEGDLVSIQAAREYLALLWQQYQGASRKLKSQLLDEVTRNLGIHRKSAVRLLNSKHEPRTKQGRKGGGRKPYSEDSKRRIVILWKDMGYMGSRRMKAAISDWLDSYSYEEIDNKVRQELKRMSAKTIERFLEEAKSELRRKRNSGTTRGIRKLVTEIPIRDLDFVPDEPGHCELDTVAHCGGSLSGTFAWSLTITDILTGWTETYALWGKTGRNVQKALEILVRYLPFPLRCMYVDNGCEFLNEEVVEDFARQRGIRVFRSRPRRKNDQCYVEQKNFTHVRELMGYGRIDWEPAIRMMNNAYMNHWRLVQNFYCPQQKLIKKVRVGSKIIRKMDDPKTPFRRLAPHLSNEKYFDLERVRRSINPKESMRMLRTATRNIMSYFKNTITRGEWGKVAQ